MMGELPGASAAFSLLFHKPALCGLPVASPHGPGLRNPSLCRLFVCFSSNLSIFFTFLPRLTFSSRHQGTDENGGQAGHIQALGNSICGQSSLTEAPHPIACPALP